MKTFRIFIKMFSEKTSPRKMFSLSTSSMWSGLSGKQFLRYINANWRFFERFSSVGTSSWFCENCRSTRDISSSWDLGDDVSLRSILADYSASRDNSNRSKLHVYKSWLFKHKTPPPGDRERVEIIPNTVHYTLTRPIEIQYTDELYVIICYDFTHSVC